MSHPTTTKPTPGIAAPNTANCTAHVGPLSTLPQDSSPGLLFLNYFLPAMDSLSLSLPVNNFLHPECKISMNGSPPVDVEQLRKMLVMRAERLHAFSHVVSRCWEVGGSGAGRTILYESTSSTVFKADRSKKEVEVSEFGILELVPFEGGEMGLAVIEMKAWFDSQAIQEHVKSIILDNDPSLGVRSSETA